MTAAPPPPATPAWPPPPGPAPAKPRGRVLIWLGVIVSVLGVVLAVVLGWLGFSSIGTTIDGYQRVPAAGGGTVQLEHSGTFQVFYEGPAAGDGYSPLGTSDVRVVTPSQQVQKLDPPTVNQTYVFGGRQGVQIGSFTAESPGSYRLVTRPGLTPTGNLAVGDEGIAGSIGMALGGILGGGLLFLIGLVLLIIGIILRLTSRRTPPPPPPPGYPAPGAPPHP